MVHTLANPIYWYFLCQSFYKEASNTCRLHYNVHGKKLKAIICGENEGHWGLGRDQKYMVGDNLGMLSKPSWGGWAVKIAKQGARTPLITAHINSAHTLLDQLYYFIILNLVVVLTNHHLGSGCQLSTQTNKQMKGFPHVRNLPSAGSFWLYWWRHKNFVTNNETAFSVSTNHRAWKVPGQTADRHQTDRQTHRQSWRHYERHSTKMNIFEK